MESASASDLRPAWARVDLARLSQNYRALCAFAARPVMPVVKADAYGHGAAFVARCLESLGAPLLAVAYPEEGLALRRARVRVPIVVLAGFGPGQGRLLVENELVPVISTPCTLETWLAAARDAGQVVEAHVKVDTGMSRLGFAPADAESVALRLLDSGRVRIAGLMTHLACADEDAAVTNRQLDRFDAVRVALEKRGVRPRHVHAANSAGLAFLRPTHTLVRPGLLLYGVRPRPLSPDLEVRPVMSVAARVALLKEVAPGTAVSYGGRFVAARPSRIATIPIGYADGVPRTPSMAGSGALLIRGRRAPVAGTVCMDLTTLDVTDLPGVAEGDEAVLFGDEPGAWELAERAGTNAWQVLTAVGSRLPRVYVDEERVVGVESRY